jgi:D-alanyl-D-alanine carboxypeptidase (penicillin-binding protein 5/6)
LADRAAQPAGPPAPSPPRGRSTRRLKAVLAAGLVLLAVLGVLAGVQLDRAVPAAVLRPSVPGTLSIPGQVDGVRWPAHGQARLDVEGVGTIGQSGGGQPVPIGSVAKVMTAYVVLTDHPLRAGESGPAITVTAADVTDYLSRLPSNQSVVPVAVGERLTERQALEALLLPSANNVAQILAAWDAGSVAAFVAKMNATARRLGLTASHYTDPSGFAPTTVSNAADQTVLAERALTAPAFAGIVALRTATLPVAGTVRNYNSLLGVDGVFGIKTGSTVKAGGNLVFAAHLTLVHQTVTAVGAVLGQPGPHTPQQLAAAADATRALLTAAGRIVRVYTLLPAGSAVGLVTGAGGRTVPVRLAAPLQVIGWPGLPVTVTVTPARLGPQVHSGEHVATLTATTGLGATTADLHADGPLPTPTWWQRLTQF